jgi:hypothetical protein
MIDRLQRLARALHVLLIPSIAIGLFCLSVAVYIILTSTSHEGDHYLIPSLVGLVWAISTYAFILTFHTIPIKADKSLGFFQKLKRGIARGWYWMVGVVFIVTTLSAIVITYRMISIWLRDYAT